jgi:polyhydroxyalkanoate synthase
MLEAVMRKAGVLSSDKMAGAFALLRANDLLWTPAINNYIKGKRDNPNDLMAWNADGTRMPWRMHTDYLRFLYLHHVAPWRSVYKVRALTRSSDYTFLLTSGGHNAGIVSGPVHPKRRFRESTFHHAQTQLSPEQWMDASQAHAGSWWPWWQQWLSAHSSRNDAAAPGMGNPAAGYGIVTDAPGEYVRAR